MERGRGQTGVERRVSLITLCDTLNYRGSFTVQHSLLLAVHQQSSAQVGALDKRSRARMADLCVRATYTVLHHPDGVCKSSVREVVSQSAPKVYHMTHSGKRRRHQMRVITLKTTHSVMPLDEMGHNDRRDDGGCDDLVSYLRFPPLPENGSSKLRWLVHQM